MFEIFELVELYIGNHESYLPKSHNYKLISNFYCSAIIQHNLLLSITFMTIYILVSCPHDRCVSINNYCGLSATS